ncbi:unnamed protein product [Caenorhabditis bovis]|uniref:BTB domain-containing protein n=1 Tax=Caenorhabditis bovis TaxID=2654633 RepID=A0A8S1EBW6_9PELO|nr:unnamed protein product [Caenorhabditis bovis]
MVVLGSFAAIHPTKLSRAEIFEMPKMWDTGEDGFSNMTYCPVDFAQNPSILRGEKRDCRGVRIPFIGLDLTNVFPDNLVSVKNVEQPAEIMRLVKTFRDDDLLCDVELEVDGDVIKAHRCVLAAASPYFRAMFTNGMLEMEKKRIVLNDIPRESLHDLISFIYSNEITITSENVQQLIFSASVLQIDNIVTACQQFLTKIITVQNCLSLRQFAEIYNCTQLIEATENFAADHFAAIKQREEFMKISFKHLHALLVRCDLNIREEHEVFETLIDWVESDEVNRLQYLSKLFETVRLPLLGLSYLIQVVNVHRLIRGNRKCQDCVSEALLEIMQPQKKVASVTCNLQNDMGSSQYAASTSIQKTIPVSAKTLAKMGPRMSVAGVIFCAGGRGSLGDPFRSVEAYDWRKNKWFLIDDMTTQRRHVGVVSALGQLYAIGGHDGVTHLASAEVFNPKTGKWRRIAPMRLARRGIAVTALDSAIYAVGGLDDSTCYRTVERYDIENDEWCIVAEMTIQRGGVGVSALGKHLYAIGGNDGTSSLSSCERFDPILDRWKPIASMQNRRAGAGVCVLDGYLYAIGGFDDNAPLLTCERYNADEDVWQPISCMNSARGGVGVAAMGGHVYAIGGHDGLRYLNTAERYDPLTNQWHPVPDLRECRAGAGVAWEDLRVDDLINSRNYGDSGCAPTSVRCPYILSDPSVVFDGKWIQTRQIHFETRAGVKGVWQSVHRNTKPVGAPADGVSIIAKVRKNSKDYIVLVQQYRIPTGKMCLEFPAGLVDNGEDAEQCAVRELKEETGYTCAKVLFKSKECFLDPGLTDDSQCFVICEIDGDLPENMKPDIEVILVEHSKLLEYIRSLDKSVYVEATVYAYAFGAHYNELFNSAK